VKPRDLATARADPASAVLAVLQYGCAPRRSLDPARDAISRVFGDVFSLAQVIV
jgi:hypothetical protein